MLPRILAVMLCLALLLPVTAGAEESLPSNTVGYWKLVVHPGFAQFSFPLLPANKTVSNVLGNQLTGAATSAQSDQIFRWNATTQQYQMCWYNTTTSSWQGDFTQFNEKESYWIYVQSNHPQTQTIVTFGNVVETPAYSMGTMLPGYNAVGSVWAEPTSLSQAGMTGFQGGPYFFQSDVVCTYNALTGSYTYAWQDGNAAWQGPLNLIEPLKGYWIYIAPGHTGFGWITYPQPTPGGPNPYSPTGLGQVSEGLPESAPLKFAAPQPPLPDQSEPVVTPSHAGGEQ